MRYKSFKLERAPKSKRKIDYWKPGKQENDGKKKGMKSSGQVHTGAWGSKGRQKRKAWCGRK